MVTIPTNSSSTLRRVYTATGRVGVPSPTRSTLPNTDLFDSYSGTCDLPLALLAWPRKLGQAAVVPVWDPPSADADGSEVKRSVAAEQAREATEKAFPENSTGDAVDYNPQENEKTDQSVPYGLRKSKPPCVGGEANALVLVHPQQIKTKDASEDLNRPLSGPTSGLLAVVAFGAVYNGIGEGRLEELGTSRSNDGRLVELDVVFESQQLPPTSLGGADKTVEMVDEKLVTPYSTVGSEQALNYIGF
ncbi:hypothetical protein BC826DRAFT_970508 [Russula brevipes]|nr:hypothetical protein BC826DRAFT_970508 [Russula brevipes]